MRIGVHSGNVMSGILGISRLQFDIWSSDVDLAHLLEQTGRPGYTIKTFYYQSHIGSVVAH